TDCLCFALQPLQQFAEKLLDISGRQSCWGCLDCDGLPSKWFDFKATGRQFGCNVLQNDLLPWRNLDNQWQQEALALHLPAVPLQQNLLKQDSLMGNVLVDNQQRPAVSCNDEAVLNLSQRNNARFRLRNENRFV